MRPTVQMVAGMCECKDSVKKHPKFEYFSPCKDVRSDGKGEVRNCSGGGGGWHRTTEKTSTRNSAQQGVRTEI